MGSGFAGNVRQGGIEQVVVHRLRVDQEEALGIRVDAVLERKVHQHGTGDHCIALMRREGMLNAAALGIHDQQEELFGHSQHGFISSVVLRPRIMTCPDWIVRVK